MKKQTFENDNLFSNVRKLKVSKFNKIKIHEHITKSIKQKNPATFKQKFIDVGTKHGISANFQCTRGDNWI